MRIGYAALFPGEQSLDQQHQALQDAGCLRIYTDIIIPEHPMREHLLEAVESLGEGDTLVIWKLDRLGGSYRLLIDLLTRLQDNQCRLTSLTESWDLAPGHEHDTPVLNPLRASRFHRTHPSFFERLQHLQWWGLGAIMILFVILLHTICFSLPQYAPYTGRVLSTQRLSDSTADVTDETVTVLVTSGNLQGHRYALTNFYSPDFPNDGYTSGDDVLLSYDSTTHRPALADHDRRGLTFVLFLIFLGVTCLIAGRQGVLSLLGMAFSVVVIMAVVIPHILQGTNPLLCALLASLVIIPVTYYLAHGLHKKTTVAIVSTVATLALTFLLAVIFVHLMKIPAAVNLDDKAFYYTNSGAFIDIQSFYLAALVIGSLAVLNDITISQASVVTSLIQANPALQLPELFLHAMKVGKDHIASLINTLLLVYIGASFPLILAYVKNMYGSFMISNPDISTEVVRTIVMSIGIVAAVPISTGIAAYLATRKGRRDPQKGRLVPLI
jgi:uncharacterized membrane protein